MICVSSPPIFFLSAFVSMTTASTSVIPQPGPGVGALPCSYFILDTTLGSSYHCLHFIDGETEAPGEFDDLSQNRQLVKTRSRPSLKATEQQTCPDEGIHPGRPSWNWDSNQSCSQFPSTQASTLDRAKAPESECTIPPKCLPQGHVGNL